MSEMQDFLRLRCIRFERFLQMRFPPKKEKVFHIFE